MMKMIIIVSLLLFYIVFVCCNNNNNNNNGVCYVGLKETSCECLSLQYRQTDEFPQWGQHLICIKQNENHDINIRIIINSIGDEKILLYKYSGQELNNLKLFIYNEIGTSNDRNYDKWVIYNIDGSRKIETIYDLINIESAIIYTNGLFLWPGVEIGHIHHINLGYDLKTISLRPLIFEVMNFLSDEECDWIKMTSEPHMRQSGTSNMDQDQGKPPTEWRTSTTYFLPSDGHPIVQNIDQRVANMTRTLTNQQEFVQVLRYLNGQKYDQHHDYFNKQFYQKDTHTLKMIEYGEKNRFITVLWYLTNVSIGGHTIFPLFGGKRLTANHDFTDCDNQNALKVAPEKGKVIIFYSLFADGGLDETSLHGACPNGVAEVKWAGNKWIWSKDAGFLQ